mgnify:CR=1 FL=1
MSSTSASRPIESRGYAHPDALVTTDWVAEHLEDQSIRIVESDEDLLLYDQGHIPGAVMIDWVGDLNDRVRRDYLDRAGFEKLCSEKGIGNDSMLRLHGDQIGGDAVHRGPRPRFGRATARGEPGPGVLDRVGDRADGDHHGVRAGRDAGRDELGRGEGAQWVVEDDRFGRERACAVSGTTAQGRVGPDLTRFGLRPTVGAGARPNTQDNVEAWIRNPRDMKPADRAQ